MIRTRVTTVCFFSGLALLAMLMIFTTVYAQALGDVARAEAERRRQLEEQGAVEKVIDNNTREWTTTEETGEDAPPAKAAERPAAKTKSSRRGTENGEWARSGSGRTLRLYRSSLQKLDKSIQQKERALQARERRKENARRAPPAQIRSGQAPRNASAAAVQKLDEEIADIEAEIKQLREERSRLYDEGRRDGYQPGELEGRSSAW